MQRAGVAARCRGRSVDLDRLPLRQGERGQNRQRDTGVVHKVVGGPVDFHIDLVLDRIRCDEHVLRRPRLGGKGGGLHRSAGAVGAEGQEDLAARQP